MFLDKSKKNPGQKGEVFFFFQKEKKGSRKTTSRIETPSFLFFKKKNVSNFVPLLFYL